MQNFKSLSAALVMCIIAGGTATVAGASGLPSVGQSASIASAQSPATPVHNYWSNGCYYVHTCLKWSYGYCKRWGHVQSYCKYSPSGKNYSGGGY